MQQQPALVCQKRLAGEPPSSQIQFELFDPVLPVASGAVEPIHLLRVPPEVELEGLDLAEFSWVDEVNDDANNLREIVKAASLYAAKDFKGAAATMGTVVNKRARYSLHRHVSADEPLSFTCK